MDDQMSATQGSAPDEYSTPIPQGATAAPADEYSTPLPQGASVGQPSNPGAINFDSNDGIGTTVAKGLAAMGAGAGEGLLSTLNGGIDLANKVANYTHTTPIPKSVSDLLQSREQELHNDNANNPTLRGIGYGGETLAEFMLGDEALKGLSMADKYTAVAKTMKVLEKSPRLMDALKLGAQQAAKTGARTAVVQGAQTLVRSGGDVDQAAKDAATAGVFGGLTGGVLGAGADLLGKTGDAASTVAGLRDASDNAPGEQSVFDSLADHIKNERTNVEQNYADATQSAEDAQNQALGSAEADRASATQNANDTLSNQKNSIVDSLNDKRDQDSSDAQDALDRIQNGLKASKAYIQSEVAKRLGQLSSGATDTEDLPSKVNEGINDYEEKSHTDFEEGLNGDDGVITRLEGEKLPVKGSPLQIKATERLKQPDPNDHPAVGDAKDGAGENLSTQVRKALTNLSKGTVPVKADEGAEGAVGAAKGKPKEEPMPDFTAKDLVNLRQTYRSWASGYMRGDVNRIVLGEMINAVDDSLSQMAENANDPGVIDQYDKLRRDYKTARQNLDTSVADKLKLNKPDQALDDVNKYLTGGNNALAKLNTIRKIVGDDTMLELAKSKVAQWKDDPSKFFKEWNGMNDAVKQSFFGPDLYQHLSNIADTFSHLSDTAESNANDLTQQAKASALRTKATTRQLYGNTGPGANQLGGLIGEGYKSANKAALDTIASNYEDAVNAAKDAYDAATTDAKGVYDAASEPFKGSFMQKLSEGRINESLKKGDVDVQDIKNLKSAIGDKWNGIADGIFQRAIGDAGGDPQKLIEWWTDIKPDVRSEMFNMDDPANATKLNDMMGKVQQAASVKRMIKIISGGAATGIFGGLGAIGGAVAGPAVLGNLGELLGGIAGIGGGVKAIKAIAEYVADNPKTWRALGLIGKAANGDTAAKLGTLVKAGAAKTGVGAERAITGGDPESSRKQFEAKQASLNNRGERKSNRIGSIYSGAAQVLAQ